MKKLPVFFITAVIITACISIPETRTPLPTEIFVPVTIVPTNVVGDPLADPIDEAPMPSYFSQPGDSKLKRGNVFLDSVDILTMETYPLQFELLIGGHLPTPCHELRVKIKPPDDENNVHVEVYSVSNPEMICVQVLRSFTETISLGSYPSGSYMIWINGDPIGNFDT